MRVLDVHDRDHWRRIIADEAGHQALMDWCIEHGIIPGWTFRLEILVMDGPILRAYGWKRDSEGKIVLRYDGQESPEMVEEIRDVLLRSEPPVTFREE